MDSEDSVIHSLNDCIAFDGEQADLIRQIDVFVPNDLVYRMVKSPSIWAAVENFAEIVTFRKQQAGRTRDHKEGT